jgi:predicted HicB family RNase H-like nuclease
VVYFSKGVIRMTKGYEQRKEANERYLATQDEFKIRAPKGTKDRWKAAAESEGLSLQKFIISAVEAAVEAHTHKSAGH